MVEEPHSKPLIVGRYAVYDAIASGGMATVHFGQLLGPVGFSRVVAIKRLHEMYARDPEFVSGFLDEARLAARIRHPNVVPTLDIVATKGELFLVMEYIQGEALSRLLRALRERGERVPPTVAASIVSGALQGLHAAHEAVDEHGRCLDIVHRDVSPQNILVGTDGTARVLDFGVAKALGRHQTTRDGQIKGKLSYMAPEQLKAEHMTRQADIYAAAVVLWETLTGERLFKGDTDAVVLARILAGELRKPSDVDPSLAAFDAVTMKGLAPRPEDRFKTAREMALAVERCAGTMSAAEMADWLDRVAGPTLRQRAASVTAIETGSSPTNSDAVKAHLAAIARGAARTGGRGAHGAGVRADAPDRDRGGRPERAALAAIEPRRRRQPAGGAFDAWEGRDRRDPRRPRGGRRRRRAPAARESDARGRSRRAHGGAATRYDHRRATRGARRHDTC
jgi:serine/threonine protein kinase